MANVNKLLALQSKSKSYDERLKQIDVCRQFTTLEPEKQGPVIVLTIEGEVQNVVLDKDGVNNILNRLNKT